MEDIDVFDQGGVELGEPLAGMIAPRLDTDEKPGLDRRLHRPLSPKQKDLTIRRYP